MICSKLGSNILKKITALPHKLIFIIVVFIIGFYFCLNYTHSRVIEGMGSRNCQHGTKIYLYNSKKAKVPGVNPIVFKNLEDYVEFIKWTRSQHIKCPILFLQHSYDAQGNPSYKFSPSPLDTQGGLPPSMGYNQMSATSQNQPEKSLLLDAGHDDMPYNKNSYPSYDPMNQYIGIDVPLDKMFHQKEVWAESDNPMDINWGGVDFSKAVVDSGYYTDNTVDPTGAGTQGQYSNNSSQAVESSLTGQPAVGATQSATSSKQSSDVTQTSSNGMYTQQNTEGADVEQEENTE
jgi:hypothetical protein